tara:strand:- start:1269 stop:1496 length:228 start_codon:yes stop_codon:yes gene_type:complete
MLNILINVLAIAGIFSTLIGILTLYYVFIRPMKPPADESNRIGHLQLWWLATTKPHLFTEQFPFLTKDVEDNIND